MVIDGLSNGIVRDDIDHEILIAVVDIRSGKTLRGRDFGNSDSRSQLLIGAARCGGGLGTSAYLTHRGAIHAERSMPVSLTAPILFSKYYLDMKPILVVLAQSTVPPQPGKATFNDPVQTRDLERSLSSLDDP